MHTGRKPFTMLLKKEPCEICGATTFRRYDTDYGPAVCCTEEHLQDWIRKIEGEVNDYESSDATIFEKKQAD